MSDAPKRGGPDAVRAAGKDAKVVPLRPPKGGGGGPPASGPQDPLVVDLKDGPATARQVLAAAFTAQGVRTLHFHSGRWLHWNGATCQEIDNMKVEIAATEVLENAKCRDRDGGLARVKLSERALTGTMRFIRQEAWDERDLPAWLPAPDLRDDEGLPAAHDVFACANRLIDLRQGLPFPPHPRFLSLNASPVLWDDHAECPQFLAFAAQIFEGDDAQIVELQKWMGYLLMQSTALQTALLLIGPPRSGKGTLARICRALVGTRNYEGPSLASLQERFGLAPLIGKRLAVIDEATLGPKVDRSEVGSVMRKWTAEDTFTIDQKHGPAWTGQLAAKLMLIVNELPSFSDASGALASRFLVLQTKPSFVGREDRTLEARLMEELSGIFRWAVEGARLLIASGGFAQPASTSEVLVRFKDQMADVAAFVRDECKPETARPPITKSELYAVFKVWCDEIGFDRVMSQQSFGKKLLAAAPSVKEFRDGRNGKRPWCYLNIRPRHEGEFDFNQPKRKET